MNAFVTPASARRDGLLDVFQMLSGLALAAFLCFHMLMLCAVLFGAGVMDKVAAAYEAAYLAQAGGPLLFLLILAHFILAARKMPWVRAEQTGIWRQARLLRHRDTWLWLVQAGTAMFILLLAAVHVWSVLSDLPISAAKSAAKIEKPAWFIFYFCLILLAQSHAWIGLYRIGVKWGCITTARREKAIKVLGIAGGFFSLLGLAALIRFAFLQAA